jgi:hypothetical protein
MTTYLDLADNILGDLGYVHDDASRPREAVLFNIEMVMDRLKRQRLEKDLASGRGSIGTTDNLTTFLVPVFQEDYLNGRNYFDLPGNVYDIRINGGIDYIRYARESGCADNLVGKRFSISSPSEIDLLERANPWMKPSVANPYYFRARLNNGTQTFTDRVWLIGVNELIKSVEIGLYLTMNLGDAQFDPNQEMDMPADMVFLVKKMVLDMERWALLVPQERLQNDGRDFKVGEQRLMPPQNLGLNHPVNAPE